MRSTLRLALAAVFTVALCACSAGGGRTTLPPAQHPASAHTAQVAFTMKWTNATASASLRRKDAISPSAQSIVATVNGVEEALVNRNGSPTQTLTLSAPVGVDTFSFQVYDLPGATGHLLGTGNAVQLIVDGTANAVTAVIQAVCAHTNVAFANDDPTSFPRYAFAGASATTLRSIVLAGQAPATLVVGAEDADSNVIIAQTGGTIPYSITGSAVVTAIDGAHLSLSPTTGPRSIASDTLTLAAPGCPSSTVAVQHSPAIFAEGGAGQVIVTDWYGDAIATPRMNNNDALIGYDTRTKRLITYAFTSGDVAAYSLDLQTKTTLYNIGPNQYVTWSNYLHGVFVAQNSGITTNYFAYNPSQTSITSTSGPVFALATSTYSAAPLAFAVNVSSRIYSFALNTFTIDGSVSLSSQATTIFAMATDDNAGAFYVFSGGQPFVYKLVDGGLNIETSSNDTFDAAPLAGATDTDDDDVYVVVNGGQLEAASNISATSGPARLSGFTGTLTINSQPLGLVVISTNEH